MNNKIGKSKLKSMIKWRCMQYFLENYYPDKKSYRLLKSVFKDNYDKAVKIIDKFSEIEDPTIEDYGVFDEVINLADMKEIRKIIKQNFKRSLRLGHFAVGYEIFDCFAIAITYKYFSGFMFFKHFIAELLIVLVKRLKGEKIIYEQCDWYSVEKIARIYYNIVHEKTGLDIMKWIFDENKIPYKKEDIGRSEFIKTFTKDELSRLSVVIDLIDKWQYSYDLIYKAVKLESESKKLEKKNK